MVAQRIKRPSAFTLIELLVVVAVLALLLALLLPVLADAKREAKKTACGTHIKALLQGINTYLTENNDTFPYNGIIFPKPDPKTGKPDITQWTLPNGILWSRMNQETQMYICPIDMENNMYRPLPGQLVQDSAGVVHINGDGSNITGSAMGYWSYSVNTALNSLGQFRKFFTSQGISPPWSDPLKRINIHSEAEFLYIIEEDPKQSPFNDEVFDAPAFLGNDALTDRHFNGGNLGFADGHVEWMQALLFNQVPPPPNELSSRYTRWFFPDGGATTLPPPSGN